MSVVPLKDGDKPSFDGRIHTCPLRGYSTSFQLAYTWGWQEPHSIHFLLTHSLQASDYTPPKTWLPQPNETPAMHFDRVHQETLYWQGDAPV